MFQTDGAKSTIEVVNVMLGQGNDRLDVQGTIDPAAPVQQTGNVVVAGSGSAWTISRPGFDWKAAGFLVGQKITITEYIGGAAVTGTWTIAGFSGDLNDVMSVTGTALAPGGHLWTITGIDNPVIVKGATTPGITVAPWTVSSITIGIKLTGPVGFSWASQGFLVGHLVYIDDGNQAGDLNGLKSWRVEAINGREITLRGAQLPAGFVTDGQFTGRIFVAGQHGGLTVLHGGGNRLLNVDGTYDITSNPNSIRRLDGLAWTDDGYTVGEVIQVGGEQYTRTITGFGNSACPYADPFPGCGVGSVMLLSGPPLATSGSGITTTIYESRPFEAKATTNMDISVQSATAPALPTTTLTRYDAGSFIADGFIVGMKVTISGFAGTFTISAVSVNKLVLANAALPPTLTGLGSHPILITVVGYDSGRAAPGTLDQTIQVGGDHIVVCSTTAVDDQGHSIPCGAVTGGPNSPLVIYGDTSQDGLWYSGDPSTSTDGHEFGDKPFNPFVNIPDAQNEDDEWFFGLANPFKRAGNDVIDASRLFATFPCTATACNLPTIGITAYGGAGDDTILGSQAGDHLAGGSGNDTIHGLRGIDHIYGDDGINVDIFTRGLFIPNVNASPLPNADNLDAGRDTLQGERPRHHHRWPVLGLQRHRVRRPRDHRAGRRRHQPAAAQAAADPNDQPCAADHDHRDREGRRRHDHRRVRPGPPDRWLRQ